MAQTSTIAQLLRTVVAGKHAEAAMKRQVLALAQQNLHQPEVPQALIEILPAVQDRETRDALLQLLASLDLGRLASPEPLHDALLAALREEKERSARVFLLQRLGRALPRDARLLPALIEAAGRKDASDDERQAAAEALAQLPRPAEEAALAALSAASRAPAWIRRAAVDLALRCPHPGDALAQALLQQLDPQANAALRLLVLGHLAGTRRLTAEQTPAVRALLIVEPDAAVRAQALELLAQISPWTAQTWQLLLEVAARDADAAVRSRAVALQREAPEPDAALLAQLAGHLSAEASAEVRLQLLALLSRSLRLPEVRAALSATFAQGAPAMAEAELGAFAEALAPYAPRDAAVRDALLASVERLPRAAARAQVLSRALPRLKIEESLPLLLRLFARERDDELRALLFRSLKPLSLARHPELVRVFCDELLEPGSKLRAQCAAALSAAAEQDAQAASALEEVISSEQDRELVRSCLDGYLRPRVQRRFAPLFAVIRNEALDAASRQRCLEEIVKLPLSEAESQELAQALAGLPPGTLRRPT